MPDNNVEMFLDDPEKSVILGLPPDASGKPINNPFHAAIELERKGDRKAAERIYLELLNSNFENPAIIAALGMNYAVAEKNGLARLLLLEALKNADGLLDGFKALGITPKFAKEADLDHFTKVKKSEIKNAIGTCYKHENHCDEARRWFNEAQEGMPPNPDIQNNLGTLFINEGDPAGAFQHLDLAIATSPNHTQAHWNRSLAYLEMGDYERGWPEYDWGIQSNIRIDRNFTPKDAPQLPFWNGEHDAYVLVYGEQGIGDEILFASMLPDLLRDAKRGVVFECHKKLHKLFCNSFPNIPIYPTREDQIVSWPLVQPTQQPRYPFTHKCAIGSLGKFYRNKLADFPGTPYMHPTPEAELKWNEVLAQLPPGPKIGISWIGGHKKTRMEVRSLALEQLLPILSQDATFINLQYTPQEDEIREFEKAHDIRIHHFPEAVYSSQYDDTAGLVANLDLVITVCTSVVHLAGAMGVPTFVMVPSRPAWRYRLDLDTMPWYKNTVLFRQAHATTEWTPVIADVANALRDLLAALPRKGEPS